MTDNQRNKNKEFKPTVKQENGAKQRPLQTHNDHDKIDNFAKSDNYKESKQQQPTIDYPFIFKEDRKVILENNAKIEKSNEEIRSLNKVIEECKQKRFELEEQEHKIRSSLRQLSQRINSVDEKKKKIQDKIDQQEKMHKVQLEELNTFKQQVEAKWAASFKAVPMDQNRGVNLGKIDSKIKSVESRIASTSMPLPEEKKLVAEVNALQQLKSVVKDYYQHVKEVTEDKTVSKLQDKLQKVDQLVVEDKANESKYLADLIKVQQEIDTVKVELEKQLAKRRELKANIEQYNIELIAVREKIGQQKEEWKTEKELQRKKQQEEREQKQKAKEEARNKRNTERLQKEAKLKPFDEDIKLCDKLTKVLHDLRKPAEHEDLLKLSLEIVLLFEQLSLVAPNNCRELDNAIADTQIKKEYFISLQSQVPFSLPIEADVDVQTESVDSTFVNTTEQAEEQINQELLQ